MTSKPGTPVNTRDYSKLVISIPQNLLTWVEKSPTAIRRTSFCDFGFSARPMPNWRQRRYFVTKGGADVMAFVVGGKFSAEERLELGVAGERWLVRFGGPGRWRSGVGGKDAERCGRPP